MKLTVLEIAEHLGVTVEGDGSTPVTGYAGIDEATDGHITFCSNLKYIDRLAGLKAAAVLVGKDFPETDSVLLLRVDDPYLAFVQVMRLFEADGARRPAGIHPTALVDPTVTMGDDVSIGPLCVVEAGVSIGDRATLMAGVFVGEASVIGADCTIHPNVTVRERVHLGPRVCVHAGCVLGSDGFGYLSRKTGHEKIPQVGTVIIEEDVEIGANVAIDRGTLGATVIRRGVKIDNLVHIGHNVIVGEESLLVAQVGISGSTEIGSRATLGGQSGVAGHIRVGDGAQIGGQSGVTKSIPAGTRVSGYPAMEHDRARRLNAYYRRLPTLFDHLKRLEERIKELEQDREKVL